MYGFECSEEKAHCLHWGHSGNPKQEGLAPGTRTLTLRKVLHLSAPVSLSGLAPHTRCPFTQMFSLSPGRVGGGHQIMPSIHPLLVLNSSTETPPRRFHVHSLEMPAVCRPRGRPAGRTDISLGENTPRLFSITRGRGSEPRWRNFLRRPLLQNDPFYKPG